MREFKRELTKEDALTERIEDLRPMVFRLCVRMVGGDSALAEDLTQNTLLKVFRKAGTFKGNSQFSTWVLKIATNEVRNHFRGKWRLTVPIPSVNEGGSGAMEWAVAEDRYLAMTPDRLALEKAFRQISPKMVLILQMYAVEGYQLKEIARLLEINNSTLKIRVFRARAKLRSVLAKTSASRRVK